VSLRRRSDGQTSLRGLSACGQWSPWRKYSSRSVRGQRRIYGKCKRYGKREVVVYFAPSAPDARGARSF